MRERLPQENPRRARRRTLIPREALLSLVLSSPLLALLLVKNTVHGPWSTRLRALAGVVLTAAIAGALYASFEGVLSRLPIVSGRHPSRFVLYVVSEALVVGGVTIAFGRAFN